MFRRRCFLTLQRGGNTAHPPPPPPPSQQQPRSQTPLHVRSPYHLLRLLLRSINIKMKSAHARTFLTQRALTEWRKHRGEVDPGKQRLLIERAGTVIAALHIDKKLSAEDPSIQWNFERQARNKLELADEPSSLPNAKLGAPSSASKESTNHTAA